MNRAIPSDQQPLRFVGEMDIEALAKQVQMVYAEDVVAAQAIVHSLFATSVQLHHHPEAEGDGFKNGPELVAFQRRELEALTEALADFRHENLLVTATGNSMTIDSTILGTLPDGTHLELRVRMRYSFFDGLVTRVDAFLEDSSDTQRANLGQALQHNDAALAGTEDRS